jgi:hypothetical protein
MLDAIVADLATWIRALRVSAVRDKIRDLIRDHGPSLTPEMTDRLVCALNDSLASESLALEAAIADARRSCAFAVLQLQHLHSELVIEPCPTCGTKRRVRKLKHITRPTRPLLADGTVSADPIGAQD